jgi:chemotaxis protein MotA
MHHIHKFVLGTIALAGVVFFRDFLRGFVDLPSLLITLGGTLGVTSFTYSWGTLKSVGTTVWMVLCAERVVPQEQLDTLVQLAQLNRLGGLRALENHEERLSDPLLRRSVSQIVDMQREDEIRASLEQEFLLFIQRYEAARQVLLTMGKLLPSFGMVGTLIGLVLLLRQATDPDPQSLAPALAVAVLTTLYGAVFANALVLPLATKMQTFIEERGLCMHLTREGVTLLSRNTSPDLMRKRLSALVMPGEASIKQQAQAPNRHPAPAFSLTR